MATLGIVYKKILYLFIVYVLANLLNIKWVVIVSNTVTVVDAKICIDARSVLDSLVAGVAYW